MKYLQSLYFKAFLFSFSYGVLFYVLQFFFTRTGLFIEPTTLNIKSWDVGFYNDIRSSGYDGESNNTGFFILFPLLWRISHLGIWGMVTLNVLIFSFGFAFIVKALKEEDKSFWLLWLTLPSVYFAFIPYTESLFFLFGALILYALKEKRNGLLWFALFMISTVRATGVFLLPAFLAMELLSNSTRQWWRSVCTVMIKYALPMFVGLALFVLWQYVETGIWFAYFKTQADHWGHTFSFPGLPFRNIEGGEIRYHWLSALAMLIDALAFFFLIRQAILWFRGQLIKDRALVLSAGYLTMVLMSVLFLNPKYGGPYTNIMGANRYTFITPFFFIFCISCRNKVIPTNRFLLFFFSVMPSGLYLVLMKSLINI